LAAEKKLRVRRCCSLVGLSFPKNEQCEWPFDNALFQGGRGYRHWLYGLSLTLDFFYFDAVIVIGGSAAHVRTSFVH